MGKTSFSGPAFGAYSLLWNAANDVGIESTAASTIANLTIPPGMEWYITSVHASRESTGSTALVVSLLDDSTSIATVAITSSLADASGSTRLTATAGEYAGVRVAEGSVLSLVLTSANSSAAALTSSGVKVWVYGYPRWLPSTAWTE